MQSVEYGRTYTQDPLVLKLTVLSLVRLLRSNSCEPDADVLLEQTMFTIACIICEVIIMKYKFIDISLDVYTGASC